MCPLPQSNLFHFHAVFGKNFAKQEFIPVGWSPPALYRTWGSPWQRPSWTETPTPPWIEISVSSGQRPLLDRDPLDRDHPLWTDSQTGVKTLPCPNSSTEYSSCFHRPTSLIITSPQFYVIMDFCPKILAPPVWEILDPPLRLWNPGSATVYFLTKWNATIIESI